MKSETISFQTLSLEELEFINRDDHTVQQALEQLTLQLQVLKNTKVSESFLLKEFKCVVRKGQPYILRFKMVALPFYR